MAYIKEGQWNKTYKGMVFKYHRDFKEPLLRDSRITYNPETGVGELYYNFKTQAPVNENQSSKQMGKVLKSVFNTDTYICNITPGNKTKGKDNYSNALSFYFKISGLPQGIEDMDSIIEPNIVLQEYVRTDVKTGEVDFYTFTELKGLYEQPDVFHIIQMCEGSMLSPKGKKRHIKGGYWKFA